MHFFHSLRDAALTLSVLACTTSAAPPPAKIDLAPTSNQVNLRIEGLTGTIFEGIVYNPGPCTASTASGGTHTCDGTNDGANPNPGSTPTCAIQQAGTHTKTRPFAGPFAMFDYDGTYSTQFDDFFITRIGNTTQTSSQFWGILVNYQYTPNGGCQYETSKNDDVLWAFDSFNKNYFLKLTGPTTPVTVGVPFTVNVIDGMSGNPFAGATVGGATTDASGNAVITQTKRGKALYKAEGDSAIRSNFIAVHAQPATT